MRRLILASMVGLLGACGNLPSQPVPQTRHDAGRDRPGDLGTDLARDTLAPSWDARGPLDGTDAGAEVADAPDAALADKPVPFDTAVAEAGRPIDSPLTGDVGAMDRGPVGERPGPLDVTMAACRDQVLSYDDKVLGAYMSGVNSLAFSPDGLTLAAGIEHSLVTWRLGGTADAGVPWDGGSSDGGSCFPAPTPCPAAISSVAYLPDGRLVGLFCGGQFTTFGCGPAPAFLAPFAVSPVGTLVASAGNPIRLWDTVTGAEVRAFASGGALSLAFSPDGAVLVGAIASMGVRLWDVGSGAELANLPIAGLEAKVKVAVSPDGRWFGALSPSRLQIWSLRTRESVAVIAVDPLATSFVFTRDGSSVITGGSWVDVYAVPDGSLLYQMGEQTTVVALSPDGTRLAAAGGDGMPVRLHCLY